MGKTSPLDFLKKSTQYSSQEVSLNRLNICLGCDRLKMKICMECGCFIPAKVKLSDAECPIKKW